MRPQTNWSTRLYPAYSHVCGPVRSSQFLFQHLFGFRPLPLPSHLGLYWDWTTLVLKRVLDEYFTEGSSLLDMGTGPAGVLAIYAARRLKPSFVVAVDRVAEVVEAATLQIKVYGCEIRTIQSDLFTNTPEVFDCIVFNAPYLVSNRARGLGLMGTLVEELRFSGGETGCDTVDRFLRTLPEHLSTKGWAALGVNHFHLPEETLSGALRRSGLKVTRRMDLSFMRSAAYLLRRP